MKQKLVFDFSEIAVKHKLKNGSQVRRYLEDEYRKLGLKIKPGPNFGQNLFKSEFDRIDLDTYARLLKIFNLKLPKDSLFAWVGEGKHQRLIFALSERLPELGVENGEQLADKLTKVTGTQHYGSTMRRALAPDFKRVDFNTLSALYALCKIGEPPPLFKFVSVNSVLDSQARMRQRKVPRAETPQIDLWPDYFPATDTVTPVTILRQQATLLEKKTNGLVVAEVRSGIDCNSNVVTVNSGKEVPLLHSFYLVAPALENYRHQLFQLKQSIDLYPIEIKDSPIGDMTVANESELMEALRQIFASEKTVKVIQSLIAQSQS